MAGKQPVVIELTEERCTLCHGDGQSPFSVGDPNSTAGVQVVPCGRCSGTGWMQTKRVTRMADLR